MSKLPRGVHQLHHVYSRHFQAGLPNGRVVLAVAEPYSGSIFERLRAAWWVFMERAYAFTWPYHGELEDALAPSAHQGGPAGSEETTR